MPGVSCTRTNMYVFHAKVPEKTFTKKAYFFSPLHVWADAVGPLPAPSAKTGRDALAFVSCEPNTYNDNGVGRATGGGATRTCASARALCSMNIYHRPDSRGRVSVWFFFYSAAAACPPVSVSFREGIRGFKAKNEKNSERPAAAARGGEETWKGGRRLRRRRRRRGKSSDNDCHLFFLTSQSTLFFFTTKEFFPHPSP